jgi:hypothetical protein
MTIKNNNAQKRAIAYTKYLKREKRRQEKKKHDDEIDLQLDRELWGMTHETVRHNLKQEAVECLRMAEKALSQGKLHVATELCMFAILAPRGN